MAVAPSHHRTWQKKLAREARLRFVGGLCAGLPGVAARLRAELLQIMARPSTDPARSHVALSAAIAEFDSRQQAWLDSANKLLRQSLLAGEPAPEPVAAPPTITSFELVSNEAIEGRIIASRLAAQLLELVAMELDSVRRVTQFLEDQELGPADALRPETWCLRLIEAWEAAGLSRKTLDLLWTPMLEALAPLGISGYTAVRRFFDEQGAATEDELRSYRIKRTESERHAPAATASAAAAAVAAATHQAGGMAAAQGTAGAASMPSGLMPAGGAAAPGWVAMGAARQKSQGVLARLRGFLHNVAGGRSNGGPTSVRASLGDAGGYVISPALQHALVSPPTAIQSAWFHTAPADDDFDPGQVVAPVALAVRQQSSALKSVASSDEEKAIIEIIALMFQSILNEDRIPAGIRIWFARLQVPVLRVALAEPAFFNDTEHPARQLIDRMGACVLGFEAAALNGTSLEAEVKRVVQVIEQYPDTGSRVFQLVLKEFQKFLEKNLTGQTATARELVSLAQQIEQKETLAIQYTIQLRDMLLEMPVDSDVREFLFKQWSDVLAMSAIRFGAEHENTQKFKKAALDLVWSASAKPSKEERAKVIRQLPLLQTVLRQGLTLSNIVGERQDEMIKSLMDIVAEAFLAKTNEIPQERIIALAERLAHLEDALDEVVTEEYPLSAESIELMLGIDTSSIQVIADDGALVQPEVLEWAKNLSLGNWFLLDHNASPLQVQYVWHSQHKQLHLFAALSGSCFLFQMRRMGHYLQAGLLLPRDAEGITARAARDALAKIEANPERLLQ
ncbi:DUF1631 family protein [Comamonas sp.]|uniref:DUF1631 family protein n=1 Tax=Comamonas sp. TaxID=34028 RepID=UPI003D095C24